LKGERGFALVITLLITALLVALTAEFVNEVFVDTSARQNFTDGQQASLLAGSGVDAAIKLIKYGQSLNPGYTSQAQLEQLAKLLHIKDDNGTIQVTVEDESGKLNLNSAWGDNGTALPPYSEIAARLIKNSGLSLDLLDALTDWRDTDDNPHPAGAENPYYRKLKPPYEARNGKLSTVEELRLVKGIDAAAFKKLRPFLTVYDDCPKININTAPKEVIAAFADDITADLAAAVVDYRKTHPFQNLNELMNVPGMSGKINTLSLPTYATVMGTAYRIFSEAKVNETVRDIEAVVGSGGQILYWREY
jgi:general secretion pathway protein K